MTRRRKKESGVKESKESEDDPNEWFTFLTTKEIRCRIGRKAQIERRER